MRVAILGSTGSVGCSTLDVIARHPQRFEVFGLSGHRRLDELLAQCRRWNPAWVVVPDARRARDLRRSLAGSGLRTEVLEGAPALEQLAGHPDVDAVMAAIVGSAGLRPCMAAARSGKRLLLANKEALVVGGALFMSAVQQGGAELIPIDSEHSAIFQCLPRERGRWTARIDHIVLTASGGPFRTRDPQTLDAVTPEEACAHPNWVMGRKISVDSATMMNKALEVIEARWLFDLMPDRIRVVLHPQSIVHSMVVCCDASVLAQMGTPDMRVPIAYGLSHPDRIESGAERLDLTALAGLSFEALDERRFPGLRLAYACLAGREGSSAVLNAANEVAVEAFLERRLPFTGIHAVNCRVLEDVVIDTATLRSVDDLLELDARARSAALARVREIGRR